MASHSYTEREIEIFLKSRLNYFSHFEIIVSLFKRRFLKL